MENSGGWDPACNDRGIVNGIYKPLEVHLEQFEFNFYIKLKLKS